MYGNQAAYAEWERFKEENRPATAAAREEIGDFFSGIGESIKETYFDPYSIGGEYMSGKGMFSPEVNKGFAGTVGTEGEAGAVTSMNVAGQTQGGWVVNDQGKVEFDPNFRSISNRVVGQDMVWDKPQKTYVASGLDITRGIAAGSARYSAEAVDYARDPKTGEITNRELLPNVMSDFVIQQVAGNVMEPGATREDFAEWAGYEETSPGVWMIKDPEDMGNYGYGGYGGYRGGGGYGYPSSNYGAPAVAYNWRIRITA